MRKLMFVVALAAAIGFSSFSFAKEKGAAKGGLGGKVTAVAKDSTDSKITDITIVSGKKKDNPGTETVIKADDTTKVTKDDGSAGTLADVTTGVNIKVTQGANGHADTITLVAPRKKK